jgi:hypothetical protein
MKKILIASAALAMVTVPAMAQTGTTQSTAPTSADRTVGAVGSERGNNASSLNGSNAAAGGPYTGANSMNNTDAGRTSGGGSGGGAGGGAAGGSN